MEDPFLALSAEASRIERDASLSPQERRRLRGLLKGIRVAIASGLPMQINDDEPTKKLRLQRVFRPRTGAANDLPRHRIEKPGSWYLFPIASAVTAAARLLLHIAISVVREMGGTVAYWDTDSVFVVATPMGDVIPFPGGPHRTGDGRPAIRALSFAEVHELRWRIEALFPFADALQTHADVSTPNGLWKRVAEPGLLRVEPENHTGPLGFRSDVELGARAPKRYVVSRLQYPGGHVEISEEGRGVVVEPSRESVRELTTVEPVRASEHGLPYLAPKGHPDWISEGFEYLIRLAKDLPAKVPDWWDDPAIVVVPVSFPPHADLDPALRPFSRLAVQNVPLLGPVVSAYHEGFDPTTAPWRDLNGNEVLTRFPGGVHIGETLGQALRQVWATSDAMALDPEGLPVAAGTEGLLTPAPLVAIGVRILGKDSRHLGAGRGTLSSADHMDYGGEEAWPDVLRALSLLAPDGRARERLAHEARISPRWLDEIAAGRARPSREVEERIVDAVSRAASEYMAMLGSAHDQPSSPVGIISQFLEVDAPPARTCQQCGRLLQGRQRLWCSETHRKQFEREAQRQWEF